MSVMVVMYHYVRDANSTDHPGIVGLSAPEFEQQVEHLLRHHEPVTPEALLDCVASDACLPDNGLMLTFDDGLIDHWDTVLPVLETHRLRAVFAPIGDPYVNRRVPFVQKNQFVRGVLGEDRLPDAFAERAEALGLGADVRRHIENAPVEDLHPGSVKYQRYKYATNVSISTEACAKVMDALFAECVGSEEDFIREQYMTEEQIKELAARGHTIASHTMTHSPLRRLSYSEKRAEIEVSLDWLETLLGDRPRWLDYPYGEYDAECESISREVDLGVSYRAFPPLWSEAGERHRVPRLDAGSLPTDARAPMSDWSRLLVGHKTATERQ